MPFPIEISACPLCGSGDTVCRLACAEEASVSKATFTSLDKSFTPFQDIAKVMAPMLRGILCHYDICANCGNRYCTRAEVTSMPVEIRLQAGAPGERWKKER